MRITGRTKMSAYKRLQYALKVSDIDFQAEVKKFEVPTKIGFIPITKMEEIPIKKIIDIWDCKDNNDLMKNTIEIFLTNNWWKKLLYKVFYFNEKRLPLIDFTRLLLHTSDIVKITSDYFKSCKTIETDPRHKAILEKYQGSHLNLISRFCEAFPAYTMEMALKVSWVDIYLCIKAQTDKTNIDIEVAQLEPIKK